MGYLKLRRSHLQHVVGEALKEDIGKRDITSELLIPEGKVVWAVILAKEDYVVCGLDIAKLVFKTVDKKIQFKPCAWDGQYIKKGKILARIEGKARSILIAERTALNFLTHLCGIANITKKFVQAIRPYRVKIMDTRKTIPGLRDLQKYAVRTGGGFNHRFKLDEMVLLKDNHLAALGVTRYAPGATRYALYLKDIIKKIKAKKIKIEIEVTNLKEFKEALELEPDVIMLDNMRIDDIKKAVKIRNRLSPNTYHLTPKIEASGGITLKNVKKIAATGVDMISVGALTHSVKSTDISLEIL